jgi:sigma54-dependent transcription regulator
MMTPEQMQNTMQFIVENHANAMIRLDRLEAESRELTIKMDRQQKEIDSLSETSRRMLEISRKQSGHNSNVEQILKAVTEILTSQAIRLQWLEERSQ